MTTDILNRIPGSRPRTPYAAPTGFVVEDTPSGYIIEPLAGATWGRMVFQGAIMSVGACALALAASLLVLSPQQDLVICFPLAMSIFCIGSLLMWFASRGLRPSFEIDLDENELREVALDRTGQITVRARYGFDRFGATYIDRTGRSPSLCLRFSRGAGRLFVTTGEEHRLEMLRDRLGRDLAR